MAQAHQQVLQHPGITCVQLDRISLIAVQTTLQQDVVLEGENQSHLSLVLIAQGAGHFCLENQRIRHFEADMMLLSCSRFPCRGTDFFPRHYLYDMVIINFPVNMLPVLESAGIDTGCRGGQVFSAQAGEALQALQSAIVQAMRDTSALGRLHLESLLLSALCSSVRTVQQQLELAQRQTPMFTRDRQRLILARDYIRQHATQPLELEEVARQAGINQQTLKRGFRTLFAVTPWQYVMQCRLEAAERMISQGALSLDEIASQCGFSHASHLSRLFLRQYGQTPGRYRRQYGTL